MYLVYVFPFLYLLICLTLLKYFFGKKKNENTLCSAKMQNGNSFLNCILCVRGYALVQKQKQI